eukprot:gene4250-6029_t
MKSAYINFALICSIFNINYGNYLIEAFIQNNGCGKGWRLYADNNKDVGKIYQLKGQPPLELQRLFQENDTRGSKMLNEKQNKVGKDIKSSKPGGKSIVSVKDDKNMKGNNKKSNTNTKNEVDDYDVDRLEKEVLAKYAAKFSGFGSVSSSPLASPTIAISTKSTTRSIEQVSPKSEVKKKPRLFRKPFIGNPMNTTTDSSVISLNSNELENFMIDDTIIQENNQKKDFISKPYIKKNMENNIDSNVGSKTAEYRLRKPIINLEKENIKIKEEQNKININLIKEKEMQEKRKSKIAEEKQDFIKFQFVNDDHKLSNDNNQLFTTSSFEDIGINDKKILRNLEKMKIYNPTKIQEITIPVLSKGIDAVIHAQTGSGKTLSFLLPLINIVDPTKRKVQALIIAPSRELVTQIGKVGEMLFQDTNYQILSLIGGANVRNQIKHLREDKPQIIVATPGRLAELIFKLEKIRLGMVRSVVIDEVDNMLNEPYIGELQTILQATPLFNRLNIPIQTSNPSLLPAKKNDLNNNNNLEDMISSDENFQTIEDNNEINDEYNDDNSGNESSQRMVCFASATGNDPSVTAFADQYCLPGWRRLAVSSTGMLPSTITHGLISSPRMRSLDMLKKFLKAKPYIQQALIFVNDPHRVEIICEKLLEMGIIAAPLHGDSSKDDRKEVLARIRDGRLSVVVSTELAARGIDIPDLSHVINFELPTDAQHYVHR